MTSFIREHKVFYVCESDNGEKLNAGPKARKDFELICSRLGFEQLRIDKLSEKATDGALKKGFRHIAQAKAWSRAMKAIDSSVVFVNYPLLGHSLFHSIWIRLLDSRDVRIVLFVHDLNSLRPDFESSMSAISRLRMTAEEKSLLSKAPCIIAHNAKMKNALVQQFSLDENVIVCLDCFDYLASVGKPCKHSKSGPIAIAGNLSSEKAGYIYNLPAEGRFAVYGAPLDGALPSNAVYMGGFAGDDLPNILDGCFGLVWDGPNIDTCSGTFGEYLKFNNPHKASLYISAGLPLLVWDKSAIASFVKQAGIGLAGASIAELIQKSKELSEAEYETMCTNVQGLSGLLREGWFTQKSIADACTVLGVQIG